MKKFGKWFTVFILLMFVGSAFAFAFMYAPSSTPQKTHENVIYYPLSNYEDAYFLQKNTVIIKYFYSQDCEDCEYFERQIADLLDFFGSYIFVQAIDVEAYANETETLGIEKVPTVYLKGNSIETVTDKISNDEMITKVCLLYFSYVPQCNVF